MSLCVTLLDASGGLLQVADTTHPVPGQPVLSLETKPSVESVSEAA